MRRPPFLVPLAATPLVVAAALVGVPPAHTAATPSVPAGAQALPDQSYLASVTGTCTHHVSTGGSDSKAGTSAQEAWRTIGKAITALQPGQSACVHAGTYAETGRATGRDGTATAPIALRGAPGEARPVVTVAVDDPLITLRHGYWVVENLEIDKRGTDDNAVRIDGGHHITVRGMSVHNGRGTAAVVTANGAHDVVVDDSEIYNFRRTVNGQRDDAHAIAIVRNTTRVLARGNRLHDLSGDGIQCQGMNDEGTPSPTASDSSDLTLEDNRIYANDENAVDVKSCQRVSIRGSVPPDQPGSAANNKLYGLTREGAVVIHFYARGVLVENTRMWGSCEGIGVGRADYPPVRNVVIRRSLFFGMLGSGGCKGNGLRITNGQDVEIYGNTFDGTPGAAISLTADNAGPYYGDNHKVWNNVIRNAGAWINLHRPKGSNSRYEGGRNLFWNADGTTDHLWLDFSPMSLPAWHGQTGQDQDSRVGDPMFVPDPANNDYYTLPGSPARDRAVPTPGVTFCGSGPDIGFRESCS
jgi:hypothetical protein